MTSGTTANDSSNAWYTVTVAEPANTACHLSISLTAGVPGVFFDLYLNDVSGSPIATAATSASAASPPAGSTVTYYIHVYDSSPPAPPIQTGMFTLNLSTAGPSGTPNNTPATAEPLAAVSCASLSGPQANGTTGNDGSSAWYVVNFTGPATIFNSPCHLNISVSPPAVFDLYQNSAAGPAIVTGTTSAFLQSPSTGTTVTYYIHVYDVSFSPLLQTGGFTLDVFTTQ